MQLLILYYSLYGHIKAMAEAVAGGVESVPGVKAKLMRVPETLPEEILEKMGALAFQQSLASVPVASVADLAEADGLILGTPTRYGNMCGQVAQFLDSTVSLWQKGEMVGKIGSAFSSSATQHGGNEATLLGIHKFMLHQGMVIAGLPYAFQGQLGVETIKGGSPYGATTIAGVQGERQPGEQDLAGATFQGKYVAELTKKLRG